MNAKQPEICPQCGAPMPQNAPAGLCPRCLMSMNLAPQTVLTGEPAAASGSHKTPPASPEQMAKFFPNFEIIECLGRGGMGVVYKARQKSLNRLVALKILAPEREKDAAFAQRFAVEAETLAKLNHPNTVTIHDFGQTGGLFYLVMEFVDGVTLRQLLKAGRVSPREALAIVPQICDALQAAHDLGIVHRDIKPENILLDRRGRVKVADFCLAKLVGDASAASLEAGKIMGTPPYMAPEQQENPGAVDHRADIYALGVVFYQMLTGELPGRSLQPPSQKVHVDVRLDEVVLRALAGKPELRYQQVSEMKTRLDTIAGAPASADRKVWRLSAPFVSPEVREIIAHFTKAEGEEASFFGILYGLWVMFATFGTVYLIHHFPAPGNWIVASIIVLLHLVCIPIALRMQRKYLCSTAWARTQGFDPAKLRSFSFKPAEFWGPHLAVYMGFLLVVLSLTYAISHYLSSNVIQPLREVERWVMPTNAIPASKETWAPTLAPGEKPDLQRILIEARNLTASHQYKASLQRYLWFYYHAVEIDPSYGAVAMTLPEGDWKELGRRYPRAKLALLEIRDRDSRQIADGHGYSGLFMEVQSINTGLDDDDATCALFKIIAQRDKSLAQQCYFLVQPFLIQRGEFELCLSYVGDPQVNFNSLCRTHATTHVDNYFVDRTCQLIEILVLSGREPEAEKIQSQALQIVDDPKLKSAVSDAERKKAVPQASGKIDSSTVGRKP